MTTAYAYPAADTAEGETTQPSPQEERAERPSMSEVYQMLEERRSYFGQLHTEMDVDEDFLNFSAVWKSTVADKYIDGFPDGYRVKTPSIAKGMVDTAVAAIMTGESPNVSVSLPGSAHRDEAAEKAHVQRVEAWANSLLKHIDTAATESPLYDFVQNLMAFGMGVLWYAPLYDQWPDAPKVNKRTAKGRAAVAAWERQRAIAFPFDVRSYHPRLCFPDPDHETPTDVIIEEEVSLRSMLTAYPHLRDVYALANKGKSVVPTGQMTKVKKVTYVSADAYACFVDRIPVLTATDGADEEGVCDNPSGVMFVRVAYSGFGKRDRLNRPEYRIRGILRDARDTIASYIAKRNIFEAMATITGFPPLDVSGPSKEIAEQESEDWWYGAGQKFAHSREVTVQAFKPPDVPAVVMAALDQINREIELHAGPDSLVGMPRAEAASALRTRIGQAKAKYRPASKSGQQTVAGMIRDMALIVKSDLKGPVTIWAGGHGGTGATLKPADVLDGMVYEVDFAPPSEEERAGKLAEGKLLKAEGGITQLEFIKDYVKSSADPQSIMDENYAELLLQQPAVLQWASMNLIQQVQAAQPGGAPPPGDPRQPPPMPGQPGQPGQPQSLPAGGQGAPPMGAPAGQPQQQPDQGTPGIDAMGFQPAGMQPPPPAIGSPEDVQRQVGRQWNMPPTMPAPPMG